MTRPPRQKSRASRKQDFSGRRLSYDALTAWQQRGVYASRVIDELCREHRVAPRERAFALELTHSVVRRQATLDAILNVFVDRPRAELEDGLWRLLQLGCAQLVLMDRVPAHAAVGETTELARTLKSSHWVGLVNGVLRAVSAAISTDTVRSEGRSAVPIRANSFRKFDRPIFDDPNENRVEYLVRAYSYPRWLIRQWLERFDRDETVRLCHWFNHSPPPSLRVNLTRQTPGVVRETLAATGVQTSPGRFPESLRASTSFRLLDIPGFSEGWFSVQDESAMGAARLLSPKPGERVWDVCAAPGGKTTHLAELMGDAGQVIATDVDESRLKLVDESAQRLRLSSIQTQLISRNAATLPDGPFDAALVDVPCSNTGVLGKRPEARWRVAPDNIVELVPLQHQLLKQAIAQVGSGGRVVYSTCSIDPSENRAVVETVLRSTPGLALEREDSHVPGNPGDGGYQALLKFK